jgi:acyl-CoA synthetase (AMP-forming)/AMP-acid ligase II
VLAHACIRLTIPFAPLSSSSTTGELEYLLKKSRVTRLFVHPVLLPTVEQVASQVGLSSEHIYALTGNPLFPYTSIQTLIDRVAGVRDIEVYPADKDTLAYLMFSSGTTGLPKGRSGELPAIQN